MNFTKVTVDLASATLYAESDSKGFEKLYVGNTFNSGIPLLNCFPLDFLIGRCYYILASFDGDAGNYSLGFPA